MSEFYKARNIKATRKARRCDSCNQPIQVGGSAFYYAGKWEGKFIDGYKHSDCQEAEAALNKRLDQWGDDWMPLFLIEEEVDWEWLEANYPAVVRRFRPTEMAVA